MMEVLWKNNESNQTATALKIYRILEDILNPASRVKEGVSFPFHLKEIDQKMRVGEKLVFCLPAFPAKSANREKTLGVLPDMAEWLGLNRLEKMAADISKIYKPGCEVVICSDGRVFVGLVGIGDEDVDLYSKALRKMAHTSRFQHIRFFNLEDVFGNLDFESMRKRVDELYAEPLGSIRLRVQNTEDSKMMFNGIHRFLFEDYIEIKKEWSRNQVRKKSKKLAYKVIQRSNSWSKLVEDKLKGSIRLSIHPQSPGSKKFPVQLVPTENTWRTPWHSVAMKDETGFRLVTAKEARDANAKLIQQKNGLMYFAHSGGQG